MIRRSQRVEHGSLESMPSTVNHAGLRQVYGPGRLARLLWAARCLVCSEPGEDGWELCHRCRITLPDNVAPCRRCAIPMAMPAPDAARADRRLSSDACDACETDPPPIDLVHAPFLYAPPLDRLLPRFKFHQDLAAGRLLSGLMATRLPPTRWAAWQSAVLVPVPLHRGRLRRRGYDQALELARPLARGLDMSLSARLLQRTRHTSAQSSLDADERRDNLRDAFSVAAAPPPHVVLVDDVMTTGATLHAAAEVLLAAGTRRVDAWVCARVP